MTTIAVGDRIHLLEITAHRRSVAGDRDGPGGPRSSRSCLTWAHDAEPATIEAELVRRVHPPDKVHGVDPEHIQAAVVAAKNSYNSSSRPVVPLRTP